MTRNENEETMSTEVSAPPEAFATIASSLAEWLRTEGYEGEDLSEATNALLKVIGNTIVDAFPRADRAATTGPGAALDLFGNEFDLDVDSRNQPTYAEFDTVFWKDYPHKVGKPTAKKAWVKARSGGASCQTIMAGLLQYIKAKPVAQPWLNPATFLNQERWNDQPAYVAADKPAHSNSAGLAEIFRRTMNR